MSNEVQLMIARPLDCASYLDGGDHGLCQGFHVAALFHAAPTLFASIEPGHLNRMEAAPAIDSPVRPVGLDIS